MTTGACKRRYLGPSHVSVSLIQRKRLLTELMIPDMVYVPVSGLRMSEQFIGWARGWRAEQFGQIAGWSGTLICPLEAARTREQDERARGTHWSCSRRRRLSVSKLCNDQSINQSIIIHHHHIIVSRKMQNINHKKSNKCP